jgi:hypothetical protein
MRSPTRGSFFGCCALAGMLSAKSKAQRVRTVISFFMSSPMSPRLVTRHSTLVPSHLITLSARASTFGGIVNPICFAVFRLITSSNLIGCSMGRSAGLAPFRILST